MDVLVTLGWVGGWGVLISSTATACWVGLGFVWVGLGWRGGELSYWRAS